MSNQPMGTEWGRVLEKLDSLESKVDIMQGEMVVLKNSMNRGWGIVIGIAGTLGIFVTDMVDALKRFFGLA